MPNIEYFGMFCLGAYLGGIANYGLLKIKFGEDFGKTLTVIISSLFAGSVFLFIQNLNKSTGGAISSKSIYMYPVGLLNAILWLQIINSINKYQVSLSKTIKTLMILHIAVVTAFSIWSIYQCFPD